MPLALASRFTCRDAQVAELIAVNEGPRPCFRCLHHATNCSVATFRAGDREVWEEAPSHQLAESG